MHSCVAQSQDTSQVVSCALRTQQPNALLGILGEVTTNGTRIHVRDLVIFQHSNRIEYICIKHDLYVSS